MTLPTAGAAPSAPSPSSQLGIDWIGSAEIEPRAERFTVGAASGAGWDRWVVYWSYIERAEGQYDWSKQDRAWLAEASSGLSINGVLLTSPAFYGPGGVSAQSVPDPRDKRPYFRALDALRRGEVLPQQTEGCADNIYPPRGLNEPVFITQNGQRVVNPANPWAAFVYAAVERYKPGGELARANGLGDSFGVRAWEIWNEQDWNCVFFAGTPADYYQMLKVAYQVIKVADPQARVVTGGLMYWANPGWFDQFMAAVAADPDKQGQRASNFYFDAFALHWYSNVNNTLNLTTDFSNRLRNSVVGPKPIWVTESGVPLIGDDIGTTDLNSPYRGTVEDQANYVIQNAAYLLWLGRTAAPGVERLFHFQLYDDDPHGALDVFGLARNPVNAPPPYAPHPTRPGQPRPAYYAFGVVARYLDGATPVSRATANGIERIVFQRPDGTRVTVVWNMTNTERTVNIPATAARALRVDRVGESVTLTPSGGAYSLRLPAATNFNQPETPGVAMIGGAPFLLVENGTAPTATATATRTPTASPTLPILPTATLTRTPFPTATPPTPGCANLIVNPEFGDGLTGWEIGGRDALATASGQTGPAVFLGLQSGASVEAAQGDLAFARQRLTIPADAEGLSLTFWALTAHTGGSDPADRFQARLFNTQGQVVEDIPVEVDTGAWREYSVDLTSRLDQLRGQPLTLEFSVLNIAGQGGNAFMRVDSVALAMCAAPPVTSTRLEGRVADAAGWSVAGAIVNLTEGAAKRTTTTGADGRFVFDNVSATTVSLSAEAPGWGRWPARTGAPSGAPVELRLPAAMNAVVNGGFDAGLMGWTLSGSTAALAAPDGQSGSSVVLGDRFQPDPGAADGNSTLTQTVSVPDVAGVGLGFAYRLATEEASAGPDFFEVLIIDGAVRADVVDHLWRRDDGWRYRWVDLAPWRGRTVQLIFNVYQASAERPTRVWLDEVSVGASQTFPAHNQVWLPLIAGQP